MKLALLNTLAIAIASVSVPAFAADPFYANFHNVPANTVESNFNYHPGRNRGPRTLSFYNTPSGVLAAGAFDKKAPLDYKVSFNLPQDAFFEVYRIYAQLGYAVREVTVSNDSAGQPRFTSIWNRSGGDASTSAVNVREEEFAGYWNDWVGTRKYRIKDHAIYHVGSTRLHTITFVKDQKPFVFYGAMTNAQFRNRIQELGARGFLPVTLSATVENGQSLFSAVWLQTDKATYINMDMNADQYQRFFEEMRGKGFRLEKIVGYDNGNLFAAIFVK